MIQPELNLGREEIEQMAKAMASVLLEHLPQNTQEDPTRVYVIIPEQLITSTINLDLLASSEHGISDILGQIAGFFQSIINGAISAINGFISSVKNAIVGVINSVGNTILWAIADFTARVITKLIDYMGPKFVQLGYAIADVITRIGAAISSAVVAISSAVATSISMVAASLSAAITSIGTSLAVAINQVATSLSAAITMIGTSLSNAILSVGYSISQTILSVSTALSAAIASLGTSIAQTILSVSTSLSVAISQVATSISGAIVSLSTAISGAIVQLSTSFAVALNQVATSISTAILNVSTAISASIVALGTSLATAITQVATSIAGAIVSVSTALSAAITQVGISIINVLGGLMATLAASVALIQGRVEVAIAIMQDYFPKFTDMMVTNLDRMITAVNESGVKTAAAIAEMSRTISDTLNANLNAFINTLSDSMSKIATTILDISKRTTETLIGNMVKTIEAIAQTGERLASALAQIHNEITGAIIASFENASRAIREAYRDFMDTLRDQFSKLSDALRDQYQKAVDAVLETGEKTINFIRESSEKITDTLLKNLEDFMDTLNKTLENLQKTLMQLARDWEGFVNALLQLPERFEPTLKKHAKAIWEVLLHEEIPQMEVVWRELPRFFQKASAKSPFEALMSLLIALTKVHPYGYLEIGDPPQIGAAVPAPGPPDPVSYIVGKVTGEYPTIISLPSGLFNPLLSAYSRYILPALEQLWDNLREGFSWIASRVVKMLGDFTRTVMDTLGGLVSQLTGLLLETCRSLYEALGGVSSPPSSPVYNVLKGFYERQYDLVRKEFESVVSSLMVPEITTVLSALGLRVDEVLRDVDPEKTFRTWSLSTMGILLLPLWASLPVRLVAKILHTAGNFLMNKTLPISISLKPIGIGLGIKFDIAKAFGATMSHFSRELKRYVDTIGRALAYGVGIWVSQPVVRMLNFYLRNVVPAELPTVEQMLEIIRRHMPLVYENKQQDFERMYKMMKLYTALLGYPDTMFKALYMRVDELHVTIKDRFEKERKIPLSMMYTLPSASDVARMVVRDIIIDPQMIKKLFAARGMSEDIAIMYYLLHFRYPPPERLWTYYTRGISGLLWAEPSPDEEADLQREASLVGAFKPAKAQELNFNSRVLENMLKTYMKWHDYARFAYRQGWPSDNIIAIDTLADIPTKIDQRWMVRFGLYEFLSEKGVGLKDQVIEFCRKAVENVATSRIQLDLRNFCRTLQATGLHPYYVPITAVAETINTIVDERTLLRTGVINMFKEGFFNTTSIMRMLSGVLKVSFNVAYFDPATGDWKTGYINVPLRYLEMEAKLIGLRAIMDRALDILKDIQRDVLTGYQEYIIETYDEFKQKFAEVIDRINAVYASDYKAITGENPPPELTIRFIEEYYKPYVESLSIWREIWTIRRIRMLTQRWMGWLIYRIAYGVVKKEEVQKLVDYMAKTCRIPKLEYDYIMKVMEFMQELSLREYIPTPPQLATLAEYVKIDTATILKAFEQRGVPEEWRETWMRYIQVRPIADDVKALITSFLRLLRATKKLERIPADIQNAVKSYAARIGFGPEEMAILDMRIRMEEMIAEMREYVPTPSQLATLAEYVKLPDSMITASFEIRNVPEEWRVIWKNYIDVRPLADDVRELIRTYMRALEYTAEAKAMQGLVMSWAARIGYGPDEMSLLQARAMLEEMIYNSREYVPTPSQLAAIVEILPEAREFFDDVVKSRRIPQKWQELWAKYIDLRPIVDDLKRFISRAEQLYVRFMIKRDDFIKMITDAIARLGYTKDEQDLLVKITEIERWRNAWTELIGSVDRLVSLSEYSPKAAKYALGKVYEMIDSLPLPQADRQELKAMWEEYIRNRPVKSEAKLYITQLSNAYAEGLISDTDFDRELNAMKQWGFSDNEIMFYKARAALMKARKLKIPIGY